MREIYKHQLSNGITVLGEAIPNASSTAFSFMIPTGAVNEPEKMQGLSSVTSELIMRGGGGFTNEQLIDRLDSLGVHRSSSSGLEGTVFSAAILPENLLSTLEIFSQLLLTPNLDEKEFNNVRTLALHDISSIEDEPSSKASIELTKLFFPSPYNRSSYGDSTGLNAIDHNSVKEFHKVKYVPDGAILGIAGKFKWDKVIAHLEGLFSNWCGKNTEILIDNFGDKEVNSHIEKDTSQVQIAMAMKSVDSSSKHFYPVRLAVGVLSGGMAGRLFVEVREKRGLVYGVSAVYSGAKKSRSNLCFCWNNSTKNVLKLFQSSKNNFPVYQMEFQKKNC